jgi:GAF domain-containing protein
MARVPEVRSMTTLHVDPAVEARRISEVHRYEVLDTPRDGAFDRITRIASTVLEMPIAIISIVDTDRIWFKSANGLEGVDEIGRDPGLCASAILQDGVWIVEDASADPRALANPLVAGEFGLRFYAGVPLKTSEGANLGTLCVIDREPRELDDRQRGVLEDLARLVVDELELRLSARRAIKVAADLNDDVVQILAAAKLSIELEESEQAATAIAAALESSKRILGELSFGAQHLRRSHGAG